MPKKQTLDNWEIRLIKAFQNHTDKNDQSILAYFTRPNRTVNHRLISQIRNGTRYASIGIATKNELSNFLSNFPLIDWATGLHLYGNERLIKARKAILHAVQTYNNPNTFFRSEIFIVTSIIAWTNLLHEFYDKKNIDYRYYKKEDGKNVLQKTPEGAEKYWELTRCLKSELCPLDKVTKTNLEFLITIRHEIEHRLTSRIDETLSAKIQSYCTNFNFYIKELFGSRLGLDDELSFALQFSGISLDQMRDMSIKKDAPKNIVLAQKHFEEHMDDNTYNDERYAIRYHLVQKTSNRKTNADVLLNIVPKDSDEAGEANRVLIKDGEKKKWKPKQIVSLMNEKGFKEFDMHKHTKLWKELGARDPKKGYGTEISDGQWYWYDLWVDKVSEHCEKSHTI